MSLDNFTPVVWSRELLVSLKKSHVFTQQFVVNRDYEGDIRSAGDSVKINAVGPVTIGNYTKNTNISAPETLTSAQTSLDITEQKYFNFQVDDIDAVQNNITVMPQAMAEAGYGLANTADLFLSDMMVDGLAAVNTIGTTGTPETLASAAEAYEYIVDLRTILNQRNVPDDGRRWLIVPPWYEGELLKDDRFVQAPTTPGIQDAILNGFIRRVAGFNVLVSNNGQHETMPDGVAGEYSYVLAGHPMAASFAEQIVEVEAYRPELRFGDAVKGLHVYGGKLVRPEAIAALICDRPS